MKERTGKNVRKVGAIAMSTVMSFALIPSLQGAPEVKADWAKSADNTFLSTCQIANPQAPSSDSAAWQGSYVYFGKYDGDPIRFRVLNTNETKYGGMTMFLDADEAVIDDPVVFDQDNNGGYWETSDIRQELNGELFLNRDNGFTKTEKSVIFESTIDSHTLVEGTQSGQVASQTAHDYTVSTALNKDKIFLLDVEEISNIAYGYSVTNGACKNRIKMMHFYGFESQYYLRSSYYGNTTAGRVGEVNPNGGIYLSSNVNQNPDDVAPAMNLDLSKVLFASAITGEKGALGSEYKLTVIDDSIKLSRSSSAPVTVSGRTVTIPYKLSGSGMKNVTCISVVILDRYWSSYEFGKPHSTNVLYYAPIDGNPSEEGAATFTLPDSFSLSGWDNDYYVYILAEDVNGIRETDYTSSPSEVYLSTEFEYDLSNGSIILETGKPVSMFFEAMSDIANDGDMIVWHIDAVDLDKDGTIDLRFVPSGDGSIQLVREDSCSVFGAITFSNYSLSSRLGVTVTVKFPRCRPTITKAEPTDNGVQIRWKQVSGYSSYNVYRSDSLDGTYSYLASVTGGTLKYVDKTAASGKTYYYRVRPYFKGTDEYGNMRTIHGGWSAATKVTVLADTKLTAEPKSGVTMRLSWTAVSGATSYEIYRATAASGPYTYVKATTGTSTSDTGLTAGTRYYYMVRAKSTVDGETCYSKYSAAVAVALATPSMESASFKSGKGVTLTWTKASGADRYNVYRYNTSTGKYDYVASVLGGTLTYTDSSGKKGDYYKVRAYKRVDGVVYYGGWSNAKAGK